MHGKVVPLPTKSEKANNSTQTMMKMYKQTILMLTILLMGCAADNETRAQATDSGRGKTLVAYYSYTGDCRQITKTLIGLIEADVLEIQPAEKGLKYDANGYALGTQLLNTIKANPDKASSYPSIDPVTTDLSVYNNFIIVTPLWWSQMAAPMQTFLFNYGKQMEGKHVALVVSSHSSSIERVVADAGRLLTKVTWMGDALWINAGNRSRTASLATDWLTTLNFKKSNMETKKIYLSVDGATRSVTLADNAATQALLATLEKGAITYEADDYGGFEKVGALGRSLPTSNERITTVPGDIMLYQGDQLVIFYGSNQWSYTRIGQIDGATAESLKTFLRAGLGSVQVTLSLSMPTAVGNIRAKADDDGTYVSLSGIRIANPAKGIFVRDDRKTIK